MSRDIDVKVAEVLGWKWVPAIGMRGGTDRWYLTTPEEAAKRLPGFVRDHVDERDWYYFPSGEPYVRGLPHYSEDIAAAWPLVEKFHAEDKQFVLWAVANGRWVAQVNIRGEDDTGPVVDKDADTAPEAICRAFLAFLAVKGASLD